MLNPFKYQYSAKLIKIDDEFGIINLSNGSTNCQITLPKEMIPSELKPNEEFIINFQSTETAKEGEYESLRKLLGELIK